MLTGFLLMDHVFLDDQEVVGDDMQLAYCLACFLIHRGAVDMLLESSSETQQIRRKD
jgi:hypothetical protein